MSQTKKTMFGSVQQNIPRWALQPKKPLIQYIYDFIAAPLRMVILPDQVNERLHLTSLRAERIGKVLPELNGRVLDVGAGDNMLVRLYKSQKPSNPDVASSIGIDVEDWGGDCNIIETSSALPFSDESFDTVTFVACINHIPERDEALKEAFRVLRPGGRVIVTMIGEVIGKIGHAIWWYSEDKHRDIDERELMGMSQKFVRQLIMDAGFSDLHEVKFVYGLNVMTTGYKK